MKKFVKILIITALIMLTLTAGAAGAYFAITADAKLDESRLIDYGRSIAVYDCDGNKIESASVNGKRNSVEIGNLNKDTVNAFIASEDRTFYSHNGLNYKRMLKALYKNLTSFSFKEGASTISQQLIKNTHLYNDKTIARKLKEIKLTRKLEKKYSKDEILEMYLNTIYFGHNCYGLQNAANFYFSKDAEQLNLQESATLVGLLTSPNNYSPFRNPEKSLSRRNTVLKNMLDCSFIDKYKYETAAASPIEAIKAVGAQKYGDYLSEVFDELEEIIPDGERDLSGYKIYTFMDPIAQNAVENIDYDYDNTVVITNRENGVQAYKSTIGGTKRQPGSVIKPLLVYAPAIEEKILHPFTKISDEKINYNGYSPENYDKKYHGLITVTESIKYSYNVPAVKTLNNLTVNVAESYANLMNIYLEEGEKNLTLALGGMKYGIGLKELCDCYSIFANGGEFVQSHFIKKIETQNGDIVYQAKSDKRQVFSSGTCSLMNKILLETAKTGTAKKLKNINFDVAAKTGTCGNCDGNTDAYTIAYTSSHTLGVWLGDKNNKRTQITGGGDCCNIAKELLKTLYSKRSPSKLDVKTGTTDIFIDREEYNDTGRIVISDEIAPLSCRLNVTCLADNIPTEYSTRFSHPVIKKPTILVNNNIISIKLCQTEYYSYLIKRDNIVVYDNKWIEVFEDVPASGSYIYTVTPYYFDGNKKHFGKSVELERVISGSGNASSSPDIVYKDWYNQ